MVVGDRAPQHDSGGVGDQDGGHDGVAVGARAEDHGHAADLDEVEGPRRLAAGVDEEVHRRVEPGGERRRFIGTLRAHEGHSDPATLELAVPGGELTLLGHAERAPGAAVEDDDAGPPEQHLARDPLAVEGREREIGKPLAHLGDLR